MKMTPGKIIWSNSLQYVLCSPSSSTKWSFHSTPRRSRVIKAKVEEIRVCTNRTCRRQGSMDTLRILKDLAHADVLVKSCGCLGCCGSGPNVAVLPQGIIVSHCGTAARAAKLMGGAANVTDDDTIGRALEALSLMKRAEVEFEQAKLTHAELFLSQALSLKPFGGIHVMYKCRSVSRLAMGNHLGALDDAREALKLAPRYSEAYLCEGDAFMAMGDYNAAETSYSMCLHVDPSVRHANSFKARVAKLQERLTAVNIPPN